MAFTSQLGVSDSGLVNVILGGAGTADPSTTHDDGGIDGYADHMLSYLRVSTLVVEVAVLLSGPASIDGTLSAALDGFTAAGTAVTAERSATLSSTLDGFTASGTAETTSRNATVVADLGGFTVAGDGVTTAREATLVAVIDGFEATGAGTVAGGSGGPTRRRRVWSAIY